MVASCVLLFFKLMIRFVWYLQYFGLVGDFEKCIIPKCEKMLIPITRWPKAARPEILKMSLFRIFGSVGLLAHMWRLFSATSVWNSSLQLCFATLLAMVLCTSPLQRVICNSLLQLPFKTSFLVCTSCNSSSQHFVAPSSDSSYSFLSQQTKHSPLRESSI